MAELDVTSFLPRLPMTKALQTLVGTLLGDTHPVGLGSIPRYQVDGVTPVTWRNHKPPYCILYPLWSNTSGTWSHPDADQEWLYQATFVGERGDQNEWMRDKLVVGLFGRDVDGKFVNLLEVDGMKVMYRDVRDDTGISPDNASGSVGLISSDLRFSLGVTGVPAP